VHKAIQRATSLPPVIADKMNRGKINHQASAPMLTPGHFKSGHRVNKKEMRWLPVKRNKGWFFF
jgi:hypothetical protein